MRPFTSTLRIGACLLFALALSFTANAQIFVANTGSGTISKFNLNGSLATANLVTGLSSPYGIAVSGGFLYVANSGTGTIGKYTTAGVTVNASLISGLNFPGGIAVSGTDLYVANRGAGTVGKFSTLTGAPQPFTSIVATSPSLIEAVAVSGTDLYVLFRDTVVNDLQHRIGKYTTAGVEVNASFIPLPLNVTSAAIAVDGPDLYVPKSGSGVGQVEKFSTATGTSSGVLITVAVPNLPLTL